ncbi:MAG: RNase III inhibitor, partial [Bullifex sp.]
SGIYDYNKQSDIGIAKDEITAFLRHSEMTVFLAIFDKNMCLISNELYNDIKQHISDYFPDHHDDSCFRTLPLKKSRPSDDISIEDVLLQIDESFSEMVFRIIRERNLNEVDVYKKANLDRKLFSKIRSKKDYHPKKTTAVALAVSLNLDTQETEELLQKAGYALSHSSKFDIIIRFFLERSVYNIEEINDALFSFDQPLLG